MIGKKCLLLNIVYELFVKKKNSIGNKNLKKILLFVQLYCIIAHSWFSLTPKIKTETRQFPFSSTETGCGVHSSCTSESVDTLQDNFHYLLHFVSRQQVPQAMLTLCSSLSQSSPLPPSISKFISDQPCLTMLHKHCTTMKDFQKIHAHIIKTGLALDPIAASRVLTFCASPSGDINYAYMVFTRMPRPVSLYSWNTIIRAFSRSSTPHFAISLFVDMLQCEPKGKIARALALGLSVKKFIYYYCIYKIKNFINNYSA